MRIKLDNDKLLGFRLASKDAVKGKRGEKDGDIPAGNAGVKDGDLPTIGGMMGAKDDGTAVR